MDQMACIYYYFWGIWFTNLSRMGFQMNLTEDEKTKLIIALILVFGLGFGFGLVFYNKLIYIDINSVCKIMQQSKEIAVLNKYNLTSLMNLT